MFTAVLLLATTPSAAQGADYLAGPVEAALVRVIDGDSLEVDAYIWLGQRLRTHVRIAGIDAPELKGGCARERALAHRAAARLSALIAGQPDPERVRLSGLRYGKFAGRVVARVETMDGRDLGAQLAAEGLARPYDGGGRASWCELAESRGPAAVDPD